LHLWGKQVKEKRFPFRLCIQLLVFSALLGLGALILVPLWQVVGVGMANVRDDLIGRLEQQLGREIRFSSISPSIFGAFDIRNISIAGEGEDPLLTVSRFRVSYSFLDLLFGRNLAVRSVRLDSPVIDLNTVRDEDILELLNSLVNGPNGNLRNIVAALPNSVTVQVRNGKFLVRSGSDRFEIETFNLSSEIDGSGLSLDGRWNVNLLAAKPIGPPVSLQVGMRIHGSGSVDTEEGEGFFSIPSILGDAVSTSPLSFALAFRDGSFGIRKVPDRFPFDVFMEYDFADGSMNARVDSMNFKLGEFVSFSGGLEAFHQVLDIAVSGSATLLRDRYGGLGYTISFAGASPADFPRGAGAVFEIDASGDENEVLVRTLRLSLPETDDPDSQFFGNLAFVGSAAFNPFAPEGTLSLDGFSMARMRELNTDISIRTRDGEIVLYTEALQVGDAGTATFGATLGAFDGNMGFDVYLMWPGARDVPGSAVVRGFFDTELQRIDAVLVVSSFPVRAIAEMAMPRDFSLPPPVGAIIGDGTVVSTEVSFFTDFTRLWYSAPAIVFSGGDFGGTISLSGTENNLELGESRLVWGNETLLLSGNVEFDEPGTVAFFLNAGYRGLGYFVEGAILNGNSIVVRGSNGLDINLAHREGGGYSGHARADSFPIPFLGHPALLSVDAYLNHDRSGSWSVGLDRLEVADMAGPAGLARMLVSGSVNETGAVFPVLFYEDAVGPLSGTADLSWMADRSGLTGRLFVNYGLETYLAEAVFVDGDLDFTLSGVSVRLYRFSSAFRNTTANGELRLAWNASDDDSLRAELNLSSVRGRVAAGEFTASAHAGLNGTEFVVSDLRLNLADLAATVPTFAVSRTEGAARALARFDGVFSERPLEGMLSLNADFGPMDSWLEIGEALNSFSGRIRFEGFRYGDGPEDQDFDFVFSRDGRAFAVSGGPRNMLRLRMDHNDNFFLALSSPFPVRGSVIGTIRDNQINARCNDLFIDLAGLFSIIPADRGFFMSDGYVNASVDIRGTLRDPEFYGHARGIGARIHIPQFIAQELRPVPFDIIFDGDEIRFGPVPTAVGSGMGTISARFHFERWIPDTFSIDIAVPRETPIPFDMNMTGFVARGDIAGNFNVSMQDRTFIHSGDLWANNTVMGVDTDEIGHGREPFSRVRMPLMADVTVTTGPVAEFLYPTALFPIVRATPEMGTRVYVTADSQARQFSVNGDVRIRGGEIFYFQRSFYMRSGLLVFRENELNFDPRITARAEIRDRTAEGPVTLSMVVDDEPLSSFTARFESSPPLSQVEIFTLLGHNIVGGHHLAGAEGPDPRRAFLTTGADLLAQFTVVREVERHIRNFTGLDMFSVRTQAVQNFIFMQTGVMQPHVDINGRLGNYFDNTTIFGGKYIGQDMFVQGMLSMRQDAAAWGGLAVQPDIGLDFQGPMIRNYNLRIRWDFVPTSPENWFVNDNSVTFTFSRLF